MIRGGNTRYNVQFMNRREWLQAAGAASLLGMGVGCASRGSRGTAVRAAAPRPQTRPARRLVPVEVSEDRVIRTITGLRPFRPSGFVVKRETLGGKTVIHNYGHGGAGMTLSWGTAQMAVELAEGLPRGPAAVLGCGGVGLATARLLQRRGFAVTIYAKNVPPHTTSNVAGALWEPVSVFDRSGVTPEFLGQFTRASQLAHRYYQDLVGDYYGVRWIATYTLGSAPNRMFEPGGAYERIAGLFPAARQLAKDEHPFDAPYALRFMTMLIEPPVYLNAVLRDFLLFGGKLVVREFGDAGPVLALPEPVVFNCTGLGAKALFHDEELTPIKGQLTFLLPQPEVDYTTQGPGNLYMFPRRDGILLGGTHEPGVWRLDPDPAETQRILSGNRALFESMKWS
jgi:D-amino-acid oxidase